jgi:hypothetical protein
LLGGLTSLSDAWILTKTDRTVLRRCPFCDTQISDFLGRDINFIVHLGTGLPKHREKKAWADYVTAMNRV